MKKIFTLLLSFGLLAFSTNLWAQCMTLDVSIENRINQSNLIIDGEVIQKESFKKDNSIFTKNTIKIYRKFKGNTLTKGEITLITLGGTVGDEALEVDPSLQLEKGEAGMLFLKKWSKDNNYFLAAFDGMGFVSYDNNTKTAEDLYHKYGDIESIYLPMIMSKIGVESYQNIHLPSYKSPNFGRRAQPIINSFSPSSCPAGADSFITINGSNFGATRGVGRVQFRDANSGGTSWYNAIEYKSWSDTKIEVFVPSRAGTGTFRVTNGTNETRTSSSNINIPFSNLNATFGDEPTNPYYTQHTEDNGTNNDFNWQFNNRFADSADAKDGFIRSLEIWRCATFIPWNVLSNTTVISDYEASDNINLVTWDHATALPTNVLGRCYSRWSGCGTTGNRTAYVRELDIVFNISKKWHYALANASGGKFDFVSVCGHELGHAHQLGHVIDGSKMMHFSIGANQTKRSLSTGDIDGGDLVNSRSINDVCGRDELVLLNSNNCSLVSSEAGFAANKTEACLDENIIFSDSTEGAAITWTWNFGAGAIPPTALGSGPHTVKYNSGGQKDVSLTITTLSGPKVESKSNYLDIANDPKVDANAIFSNYGNNVFQFYSENGSEYTNKWLYNNDNDSLIADTIYLTFPSPGNYTVKLNASNDCNDTTIVLNLTDWTSLSGAELPKVNLFPNPANNHVQVKGDISNFKSYAVYNLLGKQIISSNLEGDLIDVSSLKKGVYIFTLHSSNNRISTKLIIE
jgi:hypothetical protein